MLLHYCKQEDKNQPKQDQTDHQPTTWDIILLPCPHEVQELWKRSQMGPSTCTGWIPRTSTQLC